MATRTSFSIALKTQHNFRRPIPPRRNILGHVSRILLRIHTEASRETKVADLELAVGVDEQVAGLQVTMQHVGAVDVFQAAENLVDEGLEVGVGEGLAGTDDGCKIAFHELWRGLLAGNNGMGRRDLRTFVKIAFIEVVGSRNIHVIQACNLPCCQYRCPELGFASQHMRGYIAVSYSTSAFISYATPLSGSTDSPLKCCSNLISLSALLARIFLLKTLVTFLIATPSPVELFVAALPDHVSALRTATSQCLLLGYSGVPDIPHDTISALSKLLCNIVPLVDDKFLVECLEDLTRAISFRPIRFVVVGSAHLTALEV